MRVAHFCHSHAIPPFCRDAAALPYVAALGEHTEELRPEIGFTPAQIAALVNPAKSASRA
jgi:hypothetical protein